MSKMSDYNRLGIGIRGSGGDYGKLQRCALPEGGSSDSAPGTCGHWKCSSRVAWPSDILRNLDLFFF